MQRPTSRQEPMAKRQALKIQIQPRLVRTPPKLPVNRRNEETVETSKPATNESSIPVQARAQKVIPQEHSKKEPSASSKAPLELNIIRLGNITKEVVNKIADEEQKESSIFSSDQNILGNEQPILPELDQALKQKHASVQKLAGGLIKIVLPSGRTYCMREEMGYDIGSPSAPPPVATNCP